MRPPWPGTEGWGIWVTSRAELGCISRDDSSAGALHPRGFSVGLEAELSLSTHFQAGMEFVVALQSFGKGFSHRGRLEQRAATVTHQK